MKPRGFNPITWDCEKQGCFNKVCRPKIEQFAECFPGNIAFGDVDAIAEVNHRLLLLEWKSPRGALKTSQRIMYERTTRGRLLTAFVVVGDPETMAVQQAARFDDGVCTDLGKISLDGVKEMIIGWVNWAKLQPIPKVT